MSSHKFHLELATRARADVQDILSDTADKWGEQQVYKYGATLDSALALIEENPRLGHTKPNLKAGMLCYKVGQHFIFYRIDDSTVYVVRILHSKMDYIRHLDDTLH
jgi:toxin ParE1/3/4